MKRTIIDTSNLELEDNVVTIKRVTKVVKGGRNMRFTALVVLGDKNGHVGVGLGRLLKSLKQSARVKKKQPRSLLKFLSTRMVAYHMT